jgi:hypothetical protein
LAAVGTAALFGSLWVRAEDAPPTPRPRVRGETLEMEAVLHCARGAQFGTSVLLPDQSPVSLTLDLREPRSRGLVRKVRWHSDEGVLESDDDVLRNTFYPPIRSKVCTVEAKVGYYPRSGDRVLTVAAIDETAVLKILTPTSADLLLNGMIDRYRIGEYPDPSDPAIREQFDVENSFALIYPDKFLRPNAFYLVDDNSREFPLTPHLRLGSGRAHYALDYEWFSLGKRQYVAIDPGLLRKLEDLIALFNEAGLAGDKIRTIYGFRPPAYNLERVDRDGADSLKAPFSLHQYGKALDVIIDADDDMRLDDLDGDGRSTVRDAAVMMHYINQLDRRYRDEGVPLYGGAGLYDHHDFWERPVQSPYVHFDVRGFLDPNGYLIRWPRTWPDTNEPIAWGDL